jgi:hypothetical protein
LSRNPNTEETIMILQQIGIYGWTKRNENLVLALLLIGESVRELVVSAPT